MDRARRAAATYRRKPLAASSSPQSTSETVSLEHRQSPATSPVMAAANSMHLVQDQSLGHSAQDQAPHTLPSSRRASQPGPTLTRSRAGSLADDAHHGQDSPQKGGHSLRRRTRVDYSYEHKDDHLSQPPHPAVRRRRRTDVVAYEPDDPFGAEHPFTAERYSVPGIVSGGQLAHASQAAMADVAYGDDGDVKDTIEVGVSFSDVDDSDAPHASLSLSGDSPGGDGVGSHCAADFEQPFTAARGLPVIDDQLIDPLPQAASEPPQTQHVAVAQPAASDNVRAPEAAIQPITDATISLAHALASDELAAPKATLPGQANVRAGSPVNDDKRSSMQLLNENEPVQPPLEQRAGHRDTSPAAEAAEPAPTSTAAKDSVDSSRAHDCAQATNGTSDGPATNPSISLTAPPTITVSDTNVQTAAGPARPAGDAPAADASAVPATHTSPLAESIERPLPRLSQLLPHANVADIPLYSATRLQELMRGRYAHLSPYIAGERQSYPYKGTITYEAEAEERLAEIRAAKDKRGDAEMQKEDEKSSDKTNNESQDSDEKPVEAPEPDDNDGDEMEADERASDDDADDDNDDGDNMDSNENGDAEDAGDAALTGIMTPVPTEAAKMRSLIALALEPSGPNEPIPLPPTSDGTIPTKMVKPEDAPRLKHHSYSFTKIREAEHFAEALKDYESMTTQELYDVLAVTNMALCDLQREYFEHGEVVLNEENAINQEIEDAKFLKKMRLNPDKDMEGSWPSVKQKGNNFKGRRKRYQDLTPYYDLPEDKLAVAVYGKEPRADPNMIVSADPSQKEGVVTRSRAARTTFTTSLGKSTQQEALPAKRRRRATANVDYTPQETSRSTTPALPPKTTGRKRKATAGVADETVKAETSPEVDEEVEPKPKRRRRIKADMTRGQAGPETAATGAVAAATPEPASQDKITPVKPSRKRGAKRAADNDGAARAREDDEQGEPPKQRRKLLTLKIPKAKNTSEPSSAISDNGESRPSTASSESSSHTADSSYSFRPKRQKRFRNEPGDADVAEPGPAAAAAAAKKRGKRAQAPAEKAPSKAASPEAASQSTPARKVPKIKVIQKSTEARNGSPASAQPATPSADGDRPKDYDKMTKSEKMSASMKSRWANGNMAQAVEKRKATLAAKKAAQAAADSKFGIIAPKPKGKAAKKEPAATAQPQPQPPQQQQQQQQQQAAPQQPQPQPQQPQPPAQPPQPAVSADFVRHGPSGGAGYRGSQQ